MAAVLDTTTLEQMWANFCKEPVSEYPTFCGPDSLSCNSLTAVVADQPQTTPDGMGGCVLQVPTLVNKIKNVLFFCVCFLCMYDV